MRWTWGAPHSSGGSGTGQTGMDLGPQLVSVGWERDVGMSWVPDLAQLGRDPLWDELRGWVPSPSPLQTSPSLSWSSATPTPPAMSWWSSGAPRHPAGPRG